MEKKWLSGIRTRKEDIPEEERCYGEIIVNDEMMLTTVNILLNNHFFRGQSNSDWGLKTSIERYIENVFPNDSKEGIEHQINELEKKMVDEFQRKLKNYFPTNLERNNVLEFMALIQHHGGVTRLLDFAHLFYVGVYFAIRNHDRSADSAVWAINKGYLKMALFKTGIEAVMESANNYHGPKALQTSLQKKIKKNLVIPAEPFYINKRISAQQGLFLFPTNVSETFEKNLYDTFNFDLEKISCEPIGRFENIKKIREICDTRDIIKIIIPKDKKIILNNTLRSMNINAETLFPDIEGLAVSLREYILY